MKVTSANSVFSIILNYITHKYVVSSKASEVSTTHSISYIVITRLFHTTEEEYF